MEERNNNRAIVAVSLSLIFVVVLLIILFLLSPDDKQEGIVLPDHTGESVSAQAPPTEANSGFVQITTENVFQALQGMQRPEYYHQLYTVSVGNETRQIIRSVELWNNGQLLHAEISDARQIKSILTDGTDVWMWYEHDLKPVCITLTETLSVEDLLGLPAFDYLETLKNGTIVTAEYQVSEQDQQQSVYVCVQNDRNCSNRYWIDLETGLLSCADTLEQSIQVYRVMQQEFSMLAQGDEAFSGRFCLPDGTEPFPIKRERLLP